MIRGVFVESVPSTDAPSATISVWFIVTRIWLLMFVCQLAKNAGVLKNPMRGIVSTSSFAARKVGKIVERGDRLPCRRLANGHHLPISEIVLGELRGRGGTRRREGIAPRCSPCDRRWLRRASSAALRRSQP